MTQCLGPMMFLGAHRNVFISFKIQRKKGIKLNLDYVCLYTDRVVKYHFFFFFFYLGKRSTKAKVPHGSLKLQSHVHTHAHMRVCIYVYLYLSISTVPHPLPRQKIPLDFQIAPTDSSLPLDFPRHLHCLSFF